MILVNRRIEMRIARVVAALALLISFTGTCVSAAQSNHPSVITVNGKSYHWPKAPVVVVLIDGGDPAYVNAALAQGLLPNFRKFIRDGFVAVAQGAMPSFTNPNNVSVITGVPPSVHGISGTSSSIPRTAGK